MGVMRFLSPGDDLQAGQSQVGSAYITGLDGRVHPTRVEFADGVLTCRRPSSDSGKLHVSWPVRGYGFPMVTSTSLPEREDAYHLPLELARGKLSEIREQTAAWEQLRMVVPDEYLNAERLAFRAFTHAVQLRADPAAMRRSADESLAHAFTAAEVLARSYTQQRLTSQRHSGSTPASLLGCTLDASIPGSPAAERFCEAFTAAVVPIEWRSIEPVEGEYHWDELDALVGCCHDHRMVMRGGPLIDLAARGMPVWLAPWEHDFLNLQSFVCDFVDVAVSRYTGQIRMWEVSAHGNSGGALGLSEEHRLALVARTLETALRTDTDSQFFIRVDQPWGEYQSLGQHRLSPFQFVDALVRSNLGLSGVNLEISVGFEPGGMRIRDLLGFSRLIDHWSQLGVQIHVTLAFPAAAAADPLADSGLKVARPIWKRDWSDALQAEWIDDFLTLLMAKPLVTGVYWPHFHDSQPHVFPNTGLIDADGAIRPALEAMCRLQGRRR